MKRTFTDAILEDWGHHQAHGYIDRKKQIVKLSTWLCYWTSDGPDSYNSQLGFITFKDFEDIYNRIKNPKKYKK